MARWLITAYPSTTIANQTFTGPRTNRGEKAMKTNRRNLLIPLGSALGRRLAHRQPALAKARCTPVLATGASGPSLPAPALGGDHHDARLQTCRR